MLDDKEEGMVKPYVIFYQRRGIKSLEDIVEDVNKNRKAAEDKKANGELWDLLWVRKNRDGEGWLGILSNVYEQYKSDLSIVLILPVSYFFDFSIL